MTTSDTGRPTGCETAGRYEAHQAAARGRRARERVRVLRHEEVAATFDEPWEVAHRSAAQRGRGHYKPRHAVRTARLVAVGHPVRIC